MCVNLMRVYTISIHSLRVEGDFLACKFLAVLILISIHSLRVEGDSKSVLTADMQQYFNPLPPCGGRRK